MSTLVTGGDGFVGQHLLAELLAGDRPVAASVPRLPPTPEILPMDAVATVTWHRADMRDPASLYDLIGRERPDTIFHLAGFASGAQARERPGEALSTNAGGTLNLCESILRVQGEAPGYRPLLIVMGSGDEYGLPPTKGAAFRETMQLRPTTPYGLSKACQELVAQAYRRGGGLRAAVARSFNLVGAGQDTRFVVPGFSRRVAAIASGIAPPVLEVGDLSVERDFTDVRDAARGLQAIASLEAPASAYNICSGRAIAIRTILGWILDEAGVDVEIRERDDLKRPEESLRQVGDPGLLGGETGWAPVHDIETTVREVYRGAAETASSPRAETDRPKR